MKSNLASLEIHSLVEELQFLVGGRVDNIYNPQKEELILQLHKTGKGKQLLRIISGKLFYLASKKAPSEAPSQFCMFLRKHLGNYRLKSVRQLESERIVEFLLEKDEKKKLIVEFFGKGNILLCDKDDMILSALVYHKWKDREIKPKLKYSYPTMKYNFLNLKLSELKDILKESKNNLGKCLAAELGLGGSYSDEICLLSDIDKKTLPLKLEEKDTDNIFKSINKIINNQINPAVFYKDNEVKDIVPIELKIYGGLEKKDFKSYSDAFDYYFISEFKEEKPKTKQEKELERINRMLSQQEQTIKKLKVKELDERAKADLVYQNYELIKDILAELRKATKKYNWDEIKDKLKGHKTIKSLNSKEKTVEIEL
ncbi:MAG: NFACT family protein [Nanoarchaeota archaeon]|nr:NFACT family protein [Nanoarchaeota archaeon]